MPAPTTYDPRLVEELLAISGDLIKIHDLSTLLEKILFEARRFTQAEAGSIFLVEEGHLRFSNVQNDKLFKEQQYNKYLYLDFKLPLDQSSLCGYSALSSQLINIPDVDKLPPDAPYRFNTSFDLVSGYKTRSVLVTPMCANRGRVVGVLEVINALDKNGQPRSFSKHDITYLDFFANNAALAVERALITRELILRSVRMSELRDPKETGAHVNRVGAYAAEIFQRWARTAGMASDEISRQKDIIKAAAILHDIGKVAISDSILKKPGRLTEDEYNQMKYHTIYGAKLFSNDASEFDYACLEIALHHHERWDGKGYPGPVKELDPEAICAGDCLQGEQIPLFARIVALADVYDALISSRVYKDAWPEEKVLALIREETAAAFDPLVVAAFFDIQDTIHSIRARYPESS